MITNPTKNNMSVVYISVVVCLFMIGVMVAAMIIIGLPTESHAATYGYVNTSGELVYVVADSSSGAFTNSENIAETSGVIWVADVNGTMLKLNAEQLSGYLYVNISGVVTQVSAQSVSGAFAGSVNIDQNSGVMLIDSMADSDMVGNR